LWEFGMEQENLRQGGIKQNEEIYDFKRENINCHKIEKKPDRGSCPMISVKRLGNG